MSGKLTEIWVLERTEPLAAGREADMSMEIEFPVTEINGPATPPLAHAPLKSKTVWIEGAVVIVQAVEYCELEPQPSKNTKNSNAKQGQLCRNQLGARPANRIPAL